MSRKLTKQAREYITQVMHDKGDLTTEEALEIAAPHLLLNPQELVRAESLRIVQRIMRGIKGETGNRICFNYKTEVESIYVNVDTTESLPALNGVEKQLDAQLFGLHASKRTVEKRRRVLIGKRTAPPTTDNKE